MSIPRDEVSIYIIINVLNIFNIFMYFLLYAKWQPLKDDCREFHIMNSEQLSSNLFMTITITEHE